VGFGGFARLLAAGLAVMQIRGYYSYALFFLLVIGLEKNAD
jgi:hypothetical protein